MSETEFFDALTPLIRKVATILQERLLIQDELIEVNSRLINAQSDVLAMLERKPSLSNAGHEAVSLALKGMARIP